MNLLSTDAFILLFDTTQNKSRIKYFINLVNFLVIIIQVYCNTVQWHNEVGNRNVAVFKFFKELGG